MTDRSFADDLLVGATAAANFTGLPAGRIYRLAAEGLIPVTRKGAKLYFRKSELERAFSAASAGVIPV